MTKNPILNALAALLYIIAVSSFMFFGQRIEDSSIGIFAPIAALSLFTLSAGIMGYVFLFHPVQMIIEGKKKQGVELFLKTLAIFGGITFLLLATILSGIFNQA